MSINKTTNADINFKPVNVLELGLPPHLSKNIISSAALLGKFNTSASTFIPANFMFVEEEITLSLSNIKLDAKTSQLIKTPSQIFSSVAMTPVKRLIEKKSVGEKITKASLSKIAENPFLGAGFRGLNSLVWAGTTFGTSAIVHHNCQDLTIDPIALEAAATGIGVLAGTILTSPFSTVAFKMGVQDKSYATVYQEIFSDASKMTILKRLYPDVGSALLRDMIYLPIFFALAKFFKSRIEEGRKLPPLQQMANTSFSFIGAGTVASLFSYPLQFIGNQQKNAKNPISLFQVFKNTIKTSGFFGLYRGYGSTVVSLTFSNLLFGFAMGGIESSLKAVKYHHAAIDRFQQPSNQELAENAVNKVIDIVEPY